MSNRLFIETKAAKVPITEKQEIRALANLFNLANRYQLGDEARFDTVDGAKGLSRKVRAVIGKHVVTANGQIAERWSNIDVHDRWVMVKALNSTATQQCVAIYPPRSTHTLQPLDVSLFGQHSDELERFLHDCQGLSHITKRYFFRLFLAGWLFCFFNNLSCWVAGFSVRISLSRSPQSLRSTSL
jgi:hypothetical protein